MYLSTRVHLHALLAWEFGGCEKQDPIPGPPWGMMVPSPTGLFKVGCALMGAQSISQVLSHGSGQTVLGTLGMSSVCFKDLENWGAEGEAVEGVLFSLVVN